MVVGFLIIHITLVDYFMHLIYKIVVKFVDQNAYVPLQHYHLAAWRRSLLFVLMLLQTALVIKLLMRNRLSCYFVVLLIKVQIGQFQKLLVKWSSLVRM